MNLKQSVPEYIISGKNTFLQILFTAVFAFVFIKIYRPFGYDTNFEDINKLHLFLATVAVVLTGMVIVILSRLLLLRLRKTHEITYALFIWFIVAEIIFMGGFYTLFEVQILDDKRPLSTLFFNAIQNTTLILLIPYTLSILFFAWSDIKNKFENVVSQFRNPSDIFIPFSDTSGSLRISIRSSDLLFIEANDNYVNIHYRDDEKRKKYIIRNTLKNLENQLKDYPVYRTHRKYSVNIKNVKMLTRDKRHYVLIMNDVRGDKIPLSKSYEKKTLKLINKKIHVA